MGSACWRPSVLEHLGQSPLRTSGVKCPTVVPDFSTKVPRSKTVGKRSEGSPSCLIKSGGNKSF